MTLKTATLLALVGVSVQFVWSLVMWLRMLQADTPPVAYWFAGIPHRLFLLGLIVFFATLFRKQGSEGSHGR